MSIATLPAGVPSVLAFLGGVASVALDRFLLGSVFLAAVFDSIQLEVILE